MMGLCQYGKIVVNFTCNYFEEELKGWKANMDIQHVLNEYKAVTKCSNFSKSEYQWSATQTLTEAFENKLDYCRPVRSIANVYTCKMECLV